MKKEVYYIYFVLCVIALGLLSACKEDDEIIGDYIPPWTLDASVRIIVEDENGQNLINANTPNDLISDGSAISGNFYIVDEANCTFFAKWDEFYNPESTYVNEYSAHSLFVRRVNRVTDDWETWNVSNFTDDDYSLVITYRFKYWMTETFDNIESFKLYIDGEEKPHEIVIETPYIMRYLDDRIAQHKYYLDGEEVQGPLIRVVVPRQTE